MKSAVVVATACVLCPLAFAITYEPSEQVALIRTLKGHEGSVYAVAFSADGRVVATAGLDRKVRLWNATAGTFIRSFEGHGSDVRSVAFAPDGRTLASAGLDRTVRRWEVDTGRLLKTYTGHRYSVESVAFSADGKLLVSGSTDKSVRLWDVATGSARELSGHTESVCSAALSPDGTRVVSGSFDRTLRLWDARTGASLRVLTGHMLAVRSVAFSPDGKLVVSASDDGTVRLWDADTGVGRPPLLEHEKPVLAVAFSPDGALLATACEDKATYLWVAATGVPVAMLEGHSEGVTAVAFRPDGSGLATASFDESIRLWDTHSALAQSNESRAPVHLMRGSGPLLKVVFSPDGSMIASSGQDQEVYLWTSSTGLPLGKLRLPAVKSGGRDGPRAVNFSADGKWLAVTTSRVLSVWDVQSRVLMWTQEGTDLGPSAFWPDDETVAQESLNEKRALTFFEAKTGRLRSTSPDWSDSLHLLAFGRDGKTLLLKGPAANLIVIDAATGAEQGRIKVDEASTRFGRPLAPRVALSADGKLLASAGGAPYPNRAPGEVTIAEFDGGRVRHRLPGHLELVTDLAFSPDGRIVASSSTDHTIRLWAVETGTLLHLLQGHGAGVNSIAFAQDGRTLASVSEDNTLRLWDVELLMRDPRVLAQQAPEPPEPPLARSLPARVEPEEWTRFRGPNGSGISHATTVPVNIAEADFNWRTELPGKGLSSPVIWGQRVFLTGADDPIGERGKRYVLCIDAANGHTLWTKSYDFRKYPIYTGFNSFASSTPAVDADHVYVTWATPDSQSVHALDQDGNEVWNLDLGTGIHTKHVVGASPIVIGDMVIIANDQDNQDKVKFIDNFLIGIDRKTGVIRWKRPRVVGELHAYATPMAYQPKGAPIEVLFSSTPYGITSLNPLTGELNWETGKLFALRAAASPVMTRGLIFQAAGVGVSIQTLFAIRPGSGSPFRLEYEIPRNTSYLTTPLAVDNRVFCLGDGGIVSCHDAASGGPIWIERVNARFFGSPVWVNGKLYAMSQKGELLVMAASDQFKILARVALGEDSCSTPAVAHGVMYLRTMSHLISVGKRTG